METLDRTEFLNPESTIKIRTYKLLVYQGLNIMGTLLIIGLLSGIYIGGYVIMSDISESIIKAKSQINLFSSQIITIAEAAELLVNICNKPEIAPFCKNSTNFNYI